MKLDLFLQSCSKYGAYVPGVSTITAGIDAIVKKTFEKKIQTQEASLENRYVKHLSEESWGKLSLKAIPVIGNIAALYWDISSINNKETLPPKGIESKTYRDVQCGEQIEMVYYSENAESDREKIAEKRLQALNEAVLKDSKNVVKILLEAFLPSFHVNKQDQKAFSKAFDEIKDLLPDLSFIEKSFKSLEQTKSLAFEQIGPQLLNNIIDEIPKFNNLDLNKNTQIPPPKTINALAKDLCGTLITYVAPLKERLSAMIAKKSMISWGLYALNFGAGRWVAKNFRDTIVEALLTGLTAKKGNASAETNVPNPTPEQKIALGKIVGILIDAAPTINANNIFEASFDFLMTLESIIKQEKVDQHALEKPVLLFLQKLTREGVNYPNGFTLFFQTLINKSSSAAKPSKQSKKAPSVEKKRERVFGQSYWKKIAELEKLEKANALDSRQKEQLERLRRQQQPLNNDHKNFQDL